MLQGRGFASQFERMGIARQIEQSLGIECDGLIYTIDTSGHDFAYMNIHESYYDYDEYGDLRKAWITEGDDIVLEFADKDCIKSYYRIDISDCGNLILLEDE